ncbi:MAG: dihydrofolate reductase family protein, partial [Bacillota bacterium]
GVEIVPLAAEPLLPLREVLGDLYRRQVTHLLVEPGPTLAHSFFQANLVDRVWVFQSAMRIDSSSAPAAAPVDYPIAGQVELEGDLLTEYLNPSSDAFYKLEGSADLQLAAADRSMRG